MISSKKNISIGDLETGFGVLQVNVQNKKDDERHSCQLISWFIALWRFTGIFSSPCTTVQVTSPQCTVRLGCCFLAGHNNIWRSNAYAQSWALSGSCERDTVNMYLRKYNAVRNAVGDKIAFPWMLIDIKAQQAYSLLGWDSDIRTGVNVPSYLGRQNVSIVGDIQIPLIFKISDPPKAPLNITTTTALYRLFV